MAEAFIEAFRKYKKKVEEEIKDMFRRKYGKIAE